MTACSFKHSPNLWHYAIHAPFNPRKLLSIRLFMYHLIARNSPASKNVAKLNFSRLNQINLTPKLQGKPKIYIQSNVDPVTNAIVYSELSPTN
jgi:hypothetical protein